MSNNLVSSLPISDRQLVQMEYVSSSLSETPMKIGSQVSNNPESHQFPVISEQMAFQEPISSNPKFNSTMPISTSGQNYASGSMASNSSSIWMSSQVTRGDTTTLHNMAPERMSLPVKRKAEEGTLSNNSTPWQQVLPNKRPANPGADVNAFGFLQQSGTQRRTAHPQSKLASPGSVAPSSLNKKMVRNDSISGKSGSPRGPAAKKHPVQTESAAKKHPVQTESALRVQGSSGAVRSKMRESLAGALALAFHKKNNVSNADEVQNDSTDARRASLDLLSSVTESKSAPGDNFPTSGTEDASISKVSAISGKTNDSQVLSVQLAPDESSGNGGETFQEFQYSSVLPNEDVPFSDNIFVKDDLLQGNGLSWAFDFDARMRAEKEDQNTENPQPVEQEVQEQQDTSEVAVWTPEDLAFEIEAELFKLFGGVNKKYKEKGRSLLFNLKDHNNPELRERVMSGEISPERLCSMSAEELASKELSQWRMAKAEEFAQMVVLPDTEVDIRRLVKKTHKGEYQVEVERDDAIAAEVSGGTSMITQSLPKKETKASSGASPKDNENVAGQEFSSGNQDLSGSLIIPTDGTDLMQGMIVDGLKDAEFLPPIVSLDEFMESLNSEPPFENLSTHAEHNSPVAHEASPMSGKHIGAPGIPSESPKDASSKKVDAIQKHEIDLPMKATAGPANQNVVPGTESKAEFIWEGNLQLHLSSSIPVGGLFQSGEKTSTREWPTSIEIKGRVRLDAFEKFLQELPMSRTRAVMILQFDMKDKLSEKERSIVSEAIDSFAADERLGYAEPASGVELYICPSTSKVIDMLNKHMPATKNTTNNSIENTLIGVVVWRRSPSHISNRISPNSSSHNKHALKNDQLMPPPTGSVRDVSNIFNLSSPIPTRNPPPILKNNVPHKEIQAEPEDDDDDIPPGFGPMAAARSVSKDDDDLPEFNFSGELNPASVPRVPPQNLHHGVKMANTPVDQVRELIQKYGQSGTTTTTTSTSDTSRSWVDNRDLGFEPWNDDDDDDIPEWRPQPLRHHQPYGHRPPPPHIFPTNQYMAPMVSPQAPPRGRAHPPPGGRWPRPQGPTHGSRWRR